MFDLEASIRAWRRETASQLKGDRSSLAELEDHLREDFAALIRNGHSGEEAWTLAVSRLGDAATLGREFAKIDRLSRLDRLVLGSMIGAIVLSTAVVTAVVVMRRPVGFNELILATHVIIITAGYLAGLLAAATGGYTALRVWMSAAPMPALRTAMMRMVGVASVVAAIFTVLGFVLGAVWAQDAWGRAFSADPKELGAILVVLAFAAATFAAWRGDMSSRLSQSIAIVGGGCVFLAWFGAMAWMNGFPLALTLLGFGGFGASLALAVMAFRVREPAC